jgi:hypothetical protein
MSLDTYANFQAAIADHLARSDMTNQIIDCITLFESEAALELFRERRQETTTILVPSNPSAITVTGAANNGSGLIRLTVSSTSTLSTGQEVSVSSVGGTTEANASWIITVISGTTLDLQGSTFTNTYTSGGLVQAQQGLCTLPTDYLGWVRVTWTGNPQSVLEYVEPDIFVSEFPQPVPLVATDVPRVFTIEGNYLKIRSFDSTPLEFVYWAKTGSISASLNWLFNEQVDCYWNGVLQQVYEYLKDYEQASYYGTSKQKSFDEIKMQRFREQNNLRMRVDRSAYGATP